jgi:hypothetical protein
MAFLRQDTNNIVVDAVLTDAGRAKLAQGNFSIFAFALSDDEIDYSVITKYGQTVGKEKIEKNTPVFEALTNTNLSMKNTLTSISNPNQIYIPLMTINGLTSGILTLAEGASSSGVSINVQMSSTIGGSVPPELIDNVYIVYLNRLFLSVAGQVPINSQALSNNPTLNTARYEIATTSATTPLTFIARDVSQAVYNTYAAFSGGSYISTYVRIVGRNSGLSKEFEIRITGT